ncbi:protein SCAI isoform X1 [Ananas comosus]|uniref:Protein SCAI isoform X1 n=1 Tax=Ananas comosus TaxID=4615 RepID=A0A6P5EPI2_ANACO|nr:protein SCAI isoform X1 [Ananas comosus]
MADDGGGGGGGGGAAEAYRSYKALVESADRKFARVRDLPPYGRGAHHLLYYRKVFKAYTRLWRFQQERRRELVAAGLRRWEIGEIASRIGQLYYGQYMRTSEARFLLGAYVFYEAILNRGYFDAAARGETPSPRQRPDLGLRYKELRFHARFLIVAMLLNRAEAVRHLAERFRALLEESKAAYPETNFKEWKQVLQEITRFLKADRAFTNSRPLRYNVLFDSHPSSLPYIARLHSRRVLRLQDALLTSYRRNEVKFTELTLDTFRMLQCLEWEPSGSFCQTPTKETAENGGFTDESGASGLIDINLAAADMTDPNLPSNPRKAIIYHPSISHLIAVIATICEELSSDGVLLIYISASGKADHSLGGKPNTNVSSESYLYLGSRGNGGLNNLYPEDLIPFTRSPLFLIIDSDNSQAFKAIHGAEKGETAALLLSPGRTITSTADCANNGSQFTYFLTAPLQAFCQLVGFSSDIEANVYSSAETILSSALAEWEVVLCTSDDLNLVWGQVLPDPFLRRLILRFIFCRAVLSLFCFQEGIQHLPDCLPSLPETVSPNSAVIQTNILLLTEKLGVANRFNFRDIVRDYTRNR